MTKEASTPGAAVAVMSARQMSVEYMAVWIRCRELYLRTTTRGKELKSHYQSLI